MPQKAQLVLSDGRVFHGERFGACGEALGEVVFNTSMTGFQEILTDPSYAGQMICMTYPHIGNTGINDEDVESRRIFASGYIFRAGSPVPSSWRSQKTLEDYLTEAGIPGICELDTRALTRHLRDKGSMIGIIANADAPLQKLAGKIDAAPAIVGRDLVREVSCEAPYPWTQGLWELGKGYRDRDPDASPRGERIFKVVAVDLGIKQNILRLLVEAGCRITVVPASTGAKDILAMAPDGVFLSNGPGDPEPVSTAIATVRELIGKVPLFGICLGHQILALALGAKTYKLKFGHHGANQPVRDLATGRIEITSQNHNFAVKPDTLGEDIVQTHLNLNDGTNEGLAHRKLPIFSVQYHPEASPGPHDSIYLFDRFKSMMASGQSVVSSP